MEDQRARAIKQGVKSLKHKFSHMDIVDIVLDFANIVNLIAVLLLMRSIIIDRKVLRGFSVSGSFLTFIAILGFEIAYVLLENSISVALGLVNLVFWLMAFAFTLRKWIQDRKQQQSAKTA